MPQSNIKVWYHKLLCIVLFFFKIKSSLILIIEFVYTSWKYLVIYYKIWFLCAAAKTAVFYRLYTCPKWKKKRVCIKNFCVTGWKEHPPCFQPGLVVATYLSPSWNFQPHPTFTTSSAMSQSLSSIHLTCSHMTAFPLLCRRQRLLWMLKYMTQFFIE